jgi:hypothetical protein
MLNLDMVGYLRNDLLHVYGTGTAREFDPLLYRWGTAHALRLQTHAYGSGPSDHASFHQRGIPVLHFFTGFHDDYHRPGDDWEKLNIRGMRRITELARDLVIQLADAAERPRPRPSEQDTLASERSRPRRADLRSHPVRLGVEGSMTDGQPGFLIQRIAKWGLADRSGFRAGDRILAIGSRRVARPADFSQAEAELQRAGRVPVLVRRGTLQLEIPVTVN